MDLMGINDDTFIDKTITMEGLVSQDTDVPYQPAERSRISPFDLEGFRRMKQPSRCVTVCLGLLCAVLLAANIGQLIYHARRSADNTERDQLQRSHDALTAERNQLEARLTNLTEERDQLQQSYNTLTTSKNDLQTSYNSLQDSKEHLQISSNFMVAQQNQLQFRYNSLTIDCLEIAKQFKNKMLRSAVQVRSMPCQTGWRKFGDSCYIVSALKKNWPLSREACHAVGADLVVINSMEEQAFVNRLLAAGQNAWIGFTDSIKEGTWMWVDGTPVTLTYWGEDQPNNYSGNQDCAEIVQKSSGVGEWNDDGCSGDQSYICEQ